MFAGYDLFREGKVRRFWGASPRSHAAAARCSSGSTRTSRARRSRSRRWRGSSSGATSAGHARAGLRARHALADHERAQAPVLRATLRDALGQRDAVAEFLATLAARSSRAGRRLAQDQYLEIRTLLSGYLLSSQGDRMLMANSVEGRFPVPRRGRRGARRFAARRLQAARARREARAEARGRGRRRRRRSSRARSSPTARPTRSRFVGRRCPAYDVRRRSRRRRCAEAGVFEPAVGRAAAGASARRDAATASSPTPTTWRWSACSRRSSCTTSSIASRPGGDRRIEHAQRRRSTTRIANPRSLRMTARRGSAPARLPHPLRRAPCRQGRARVRRRSASPTASSTSAPMRSRTRSWRAASSAATACSSSPTTRSRRSSRSGRCSRRTRSSRSSTRSPRADKLAYLLNDCRPDGADHRRAPARASSRAGARARTCAAVDRLRADRRRRAGSAAACRDAGTMRCAASHEQRRPRAAASTSTSRRSSTPRAPPATRRA